MKNDKAEKEPAKRAAKDGQASASTPEIKTKRDKNEDFLGIINTSDL